MLSRKERESTEKMSEQRGRTKKKLEQEYLAKLKKLEEEASRSEDSDDENKMMAPTKRKKMDAKEKREVKKPKL